MGFRRHGGTVSGSALRVLKASSFSGGGARVRVGVEAAVDEDLVAVHLHQPVDQPRRVDRHELCRKRQWQWRDTTTRGRQNA